MSNSFEKARAQSTAALQKAEIQRQGALIGAQKLESAAAYHGAKLRYALPALVASAQLRPNTPDEGQSAQADYLQAQGDLQRCESAYMRSRRQRAMLGDPSLNEPSMDDSTESTQTEQQ